MPYKESILWILNKIQPIRTDLRISEEEAIQQNVAFVHSLGLKCDCVGWSRLDLSDPRAPEILDKIAAFCAAEDWNGRCYYYREYTQEESDWYELVFTSLKDSACAGYEKVPSEEGLPVEIYQLRAFHEQSPGPKKWGELFVPERFWKACIKHGYDLDFCWAPDLGRYEAEQYFQVYGKQLIPGICLDHGLDTSPARIAAAGGWLPRVAQVFPCLQHIEMQACFLADDLPDSGIAYTHVPPSEAGYRRHHLLLHKDIAQVLLDEKALSPNHLRPVPIADTVPGGYVYRKTQSVLRPAQHIREAMLLSYEKRKATPRPVRMMSEKNALKCLRQAKRERKEDFPKAYPKAKVQDLADTAYAPLMPYYLIANGGELGDEYTLLPYAEALAENEEFQANLQSEELLENRPNGVVIAHCPDGDVVLLCREGQVIRFSHEAPEAIEQWPSLAQFMVDAINEI